MSAASRAAEPAPITIRSKCSLTRPHCPPLRAPLRYSRRRGTLAEAQLLEALRAGDEEAFAALVREYHPSLVRVARMYVSTQAVAEEVAQETWLAVLNGLDRFEGRSSLKTWIFRILTNIAKTRADRDGRTLPFSALQDPGARARGRRRRRPLPRPRAPALARATGRSSRSRWPEERAARRRDAGAAGRGDRGAAGHAARGHLAARHRGLERARRSVTLST